MEQQNARNASFNSRPALFPIKEVVACLWPPMQSFKTEKPHSHLVKICQGQKVNFLFLDF